MKARVEKERGTSGGRRPATPTGRLNTAGAPRARFRPTGRLTPRRDDPANRAEAAGGDVKLGPGGLADIEWTVQLLQLRHGGALPALRTPGTLPALQAAADAGLLAAEEAAYLQSGWLLASRVRNARWLLSADPDKLPATPEDLDRLARVLGLRHARPPGALGGAGPLPAPRATHPRARLLRLRPVVHPSPPCRSRSW